MGDRSSDAARRHALSLADARQDIESGRLSEAAAKLKELEDSLQLSEDPALGVALARALTDLAKLERERGLTHQALNRLIHAHRYLRDKDFVQRGENCVEVGRCLAELVPERAASHFRRGIALFLMADLPLEAAAAYDSLAEVQASLGDREGSALSQRARDDLQMRGDQAFDSGTQ